VGSRGRAPGQGPGGEFDFYAENHAWDYWDMVLATSFAGSPRWRSGSKSAKPKHIFGEPLSQLLSRLYMLMPQPD